jgi:O-methyltransferase
MASSSEKPLAAGRKNTIRSALLALAIFLSTIGLGTIFVVVVGVFWPAPKPASVVKRASPKLNLRKRDLVTIQDRYLELLKMYLIRVDFGDAVPATRIEGRDWPKTAETMIGLKRLDNLHDCITDVLRRRVPGDFIEAGAWRGGATIFMRAALLAYDENRRNVWVADSFQGVAKPDPKLFPADARDEHWTHGELVVPLDEVKENFAKYALLDERVKFLPGWFKDTLPNAPIQQLAILRIDADLYESTMEALNHLYPKLSIGGYVIVDDYGAIAACRKAVEDFRVGKGIREELKHIDWTGVFWEKQR